MTNVCLIRANMGDFASKILLLSLVNVRMGIGGRSVIHPSTIDPVMTLHLPIQTLGLYIIYLIFGTFLVPFKHYDKEVKATITQCVKIPLFVQKFKLTKTLTKRSIRILVSKSTIFSGKRFQLFEFSRQKRP